jgi:CopG family nickel-responsive transcriptional regulator
MNASALAARMRRLEMHVHLDHHNCLEVIVLRGPAETLQKMASELRGLKGIQSGQLVLARTAELD